MIDIITKRGRKIDRDRIRHRTTNFHREIALSAVRRVIAPSRRYIDVFVTTDSLTMNGLLTREVVDYCDVHRAQMFLRPDSRE